MPSPRSSRETSAPGRPQPPAASSRRAGIDPAPYDLPRNDLGEGQRGRVHPSSRHSSRGDARSPPGDILLRMTQAIERYERATYLAAAHTYVPSVPLLVAPPIAPLVIQAPPRFHEPRRPVSPSSDPYDHHYPDYYDSRDYLDRRGAPRHDGGRDRVDSRLPQDAYDRPGPAYLVHSDDPPCLPPPRLCYDDHDQGQDQRDYSRDRGDPPRRDDLDRRVGHQP